MIAILAFGSLIDDPGCELEAAILEIRSTRTPFCVEFARLSTGRSGAPTLVPTNAGGTRVKASLFVLQERVSLQEAKDMLWRRETGNFSDSRGYTERQDPTPNTVLILTLDSFEGIETVLYVDFPPTGKEDNPTAAELASAAIDSAQSLRDGRDGISYLQAAMRNGIVTPLTAPYGRAICEELGIATLEEALSRIHAG